MENILDRLEPEKSVKKSLLIQTKCFNFSVNDDAKILMKEQGSRRLNHC